MKLPLSWLKDHLETSAPLGEIVTTLTRIGLEVEEVQDTAGALLGFVVARVISSEPHPNADRLRVCLVDTGQGAPIQVVCGAPNARAGMIGVFAPPGTVIPGKNITLGIGMIRGVESRGMLCSAAELQISDDHQGIIDLPVDAPVGAHYAAYAGLADAVIEVNLTPNRPDCTSVRGIARDLAAAGLGMLKDAPVEPIEGDGACPVHVTLALSADDAHLCPAFALRLVRGVTNGPSPQWLQRRLAAVGLRSVNTLVDITNFVTFDRGRPLHVFDAAKVKGDLTIRRATPGEEIVALDGRTYRFDETIVVIADESGVESIAGIMGGQASGCEAGTTDVLIESALWDPLNIAQSGRRLGIVSDARYRFERGVDPAFCIPGLDLATELILAHCGGRATKAIVAGQVPTVSRTIDFRWSETSRLCGLEVPQAEAQATLERLGFRVRAAGHRAEIVPPTWRPDIEGKADLVEEIIRIKGLDSIPPAPLPRLEEAVLKPVLTLLQRRTRLAKRCLAVRGLLEAVTWSFIGREEATLFGGGSARLALANPIAADLSDMRPSLLPGLLKSAQRNADRGFGDVGLFEVGQCFATDEPEGQTMRAAAVRRGTARARGTGRHWEGGASDVDAYDAKGDAFALLGSLGLPTGSLQIVSDAPAWFHAGRSGTLRFGPSGLIGAFGELHPKILRSLDVKGPIVAFEITLDALPPPKLRPTKMRPTLRIPELQPLTRDFAFVVDRSLAVAEILRAVRGAERSLIAAIDIFDVYEGKGIEPGKKSVAVAVTLQPTERTLTEAEIDAVSRRIVAEVAEKTGAVLRS